MVRIVRDYLGSRRAAYYQELESGAKLTWSEPGCCRMGYTGHDPVVQPHGKSEANTSHRPKGAQAVTAAVGPFTRESETTSAPCRGDVGADANGESNLRPYTQVPGNLTPQEAEARFARTGEFIQAVNDMLPGWAPLLSEVQRIAHPFRDWKKEKADKDGRGYVGGHSDGEQLEPESAIAMLSLFVDGHGCDTPYVEFHVWDGLGKQHTFPVYDDTLVLLYVKEEGMVPDLCRPRDLYHQVTIPSGRDVPPRLVSVLRTLQPLSQEIKKEVWDVHLGFRERFSSNSPWELNLHPRVRPYGPGPPPAPADAHRHLVYREGDASGARTIQPNDELNPHPVAAALLGVHHLYVGSQAIAPTPAGGGEGRKGGAIRIGAKDWSCEKEGVVVVRGETSEDSNKDRPGNKTAALVECMALTGNDSAWRVLAAAGHPDCERRVEGSAKFLGPYYVHIARHIASWDNGVLKSKGREAATASHWEFVLRNFVPAPPADGVCPEVLVTRCGCCNHLYDGAKPLYEHLRDARVEQNKGRLGELLAEPQP
jgi:hypothetical protein